MANNLLVVYGITAEIDTDPGGTETFEPLGNGFENIAEALNEQVQQYFFLSDGGFAQNFVTGMAPAATFTGRRILGDPAQEFLFGEKYNLNTKRNTTLKLTRLDATGANTQTVSCPVTFCNLKEYSGNSVEGSAISVEMRYNGKPTLKTTPVTGD